MAMISGNPGLKYRWIVLVLALLVTALSWGCVYSIGIYYVRWIEYFHSSKAEIALLGGLPSGTSCMLGPLFGILICRIGFRKTGFIGGAMMVLGHFASVFASSLIYLGFFYGIIFGIGAGLCYYAASVGLNYYFINKRAFAEGVMSSGGGIGAFIFSHLTQNLIDKYDWMGAMAIIGAIVGNTFVLFQLMIPPENLKQFSCLKNWTSGSKMHDDIHELQSHEQRAAEEDKELPNIEKSESKGWWAQSRDLYRNPVFILILAVEFFNWLCIFIPYVHLAERSRLLGIDEDTTAWIFSMIGLTGIVGRPLVGLLPSFVNVHVFYLYGLTNVILGTITALSPLFANVEGLFAYASVFGFLSVCNALGKASVTKLLGPEQFAVSFSWVLLFQGIALYTGPFLAGWIYDVTLSYDYALYCMGCGLIFSGLLVTLKNPAFRLQKHLKRKEKITDL